MSKFSLLNAKGAGSKRGKSTIERYNLSRTKWSGSPKKPKFLIIIFIKQEGSRIEVSFTFIL